MTFWDPFTLLRTAVQDRRAAAQVALRWTRAFRDRPELGEGRLRIGRVLEARPARFDEGVEQPDPIDPCRLAYEAGQRDLALKLLALGRLGPETLNHLMETPHD